jgi:DNA polymerase I-like protein with 3'-5' exonuclease and polymerase domains
MSYKVFDLETQIHTAHKRKANPWDLRNYVVARGWKNAGDNQNSWEYYSTYNRESHLVIEPHIKMLVGFNLKFDLLWELVTGNPYLHEFFKRGGTVWDCQYAEYLLRAQHQDAQMCSLNDTAPKYGGTAKIDAVKAMWDEGIQTSEIPEDLLLEYLVGPEDDRNGGDIRNTELVFLGQIKAAQEKGMLKMIQDRMDGLLATTHMEFYGLKVDVKEAGRRLGVLNQKLKEADDELVQYVPTDLPFEFNWGSKYHVSYLIFGGTAKYVVRDTYIDEATGELARLKAKETQWVLDDGSTTSIPPEEAASASRYIQFLSGKKKGEYKTKQVDVPGELKYKNQDRFYKFPGVTEPRDEWATKNVDHEGNPVYQTNSDVIEIIAKRDIPFLKALSAKQALDKEIGTYYVRFDQKKNEHVGMLTCVQPADHMLHHKLNHTSTVTTRLSSSDPNLQNIPRGDKSEAKAMFVSRFGDDGYMIEADYSQLEVVVQGVLSGDSNLCNDLRNRIDFHCKRVSAKFGCTYEDALVWCKDESYPDYALWKKRRTGVKEFSFQRAYGAGAQAISDATGLPLEDVKQLIEVEDAMYPGITRFNAAVEASAIKTAQPFQAVAPDGTWKTYRRGYWQAPTGTLYSWRTYDAPDYAARRGSKDTFMPPELKNYPVQGTGGEFVQCILGRLWRHFISTDYYGWRAFLVNTVHDCEWTDCHKDVLQEVCRDTKRIMESIPEYYNSRYGMDITVPFPVEVEYGKNMNTLHHWKEAG